MKYRLRKMTRYCKMTRVTLEHKDGKFTNSSLTNVIQSEARDWGGINHSATIFNENGKKLMWFSCEGHGGYVLFSNERLEDNDLLVPGITSDDYNSVPEFHTYLFEEDCDWAKLYKILSPRLFAKVEKRWVDNHLEAPKKSLIQYAQESLERWSPNFNLSTLIS